MKRNNAWNISCLVVESFVPSTQRASILYWILSDFLCCWTVAVRFCSPKLQYLTERERNRCSLSVVLAQCQNNFEHPLYLSFFPFLHSFFPLLVIAVFPPSRNFWVCLFLDATQKSLFFFWYYLFLFRYIVSTYKSLSNELWVVMRTDETVSMPGYQALFDKRCGST